MNPYIRDCRLPRLQLVVSYNPADLRPTPLRLYQGVVRRSLFGRRSLRRTCFDERSEEEAIQRKPLSFRIDDEQDDRSYASLHTRLRLEGPVPTIVRSQDYNAPALCDSGRTVTNPPSTFRDSIEIIIIFMRQNHSSENRISQIYLIYL